MVMDDNEINEDKEMLGGELAFYWYLQQNSLQITFKFIPINFI